MIRRVTAAVLFVLMLSGCAAAADSNEDPGLTEAQKAECVSAVAAAAAVPLDQVNDEQMVTAGDACRSYEAWSAALKEHPEAFGVESLSDEEIAFYTTTFCAAYSNRAVCDDALTRGIIEPQR